MSENIFDVFDFDIFDVDFDIFLERFVDDFQFDVFHPDFDLILQNVETIFDDDFEEEEDDDFEDDSFVEPDCFCDQQKPCPDCGVTPSCQNCFDWWGCQNCQGISRREEEEVFATLPEKFLEIVFALAPVIPVDQVIEIFEASLSEAEGQKFDFFNMTKDHDNLSAGKIFANWFRFKDEKFLSTPTSVWQTIKLVKDKANELSV